MKYKRAVMDLSDKGNNISGKSLILAAKYKNAMITEELKNSTLHIPGTNPKPSTNFPLPAQTAAISASKVRLR